MRTEQRSLRSVRWTARAPQLAFVVTAAVLSLAGVRSILRPPASPSAAPVATTVVADSGATAFGAAFAREYLTWDASRPADREANIARFVSDDLPDAGLEPPDRGIQSVLDTNIASARTHRGATDLEVQVETTHGPVALAVRVLRRGSRFVIAHPPAVIGSAQVDAKARLATEEPVDDTLLARTASRATTNFVNRQRENLLADLDSAAVVALPDRPMKVRRTDEPTWAEPGRRVAVQAEVLDQRTRAVMTLRYELAVVRRAGRWLVRAVQPINPPTGVLR